MGSGYIIFIIDFYCFVWCTTNSICCDQWDSTRKSEYFAPANELKRNNSIEMRNYYSKLILFCLFILFRRFVALQTRFACAFHGDWHLYWFKYFQQLYQLSSYTVVFMYFHCVALLLLFIYWFAFPKQKAKVSMKYW